MGGVACCQCNANPVDQSVADIKEESLGAGRQDPAPGFEDNAEVPIKPVGMPFDSGRNSDVESAAVEMPKPRKSIKPDPTTRKSMSSRPKTSASVPVDRRTTTKQTTIFGESDNSIELAGLLRDIMFAHEEKENKRYLTDEAKGKLEENTERARELRKAGTKPHGVAFFFFLADEDLSSMLDRAELQHALDKIPQFDSIAFDVKVSEMFSDGDGFIDLEEWMDLCDELPDLKAAIEGEAEMKAWKQLVD